MTQPNPSDLPQPSPRKAHRKPSRAAAPDSTDDKPHSSPPSSSLSRLTPPPQQHHHQQQQQQQIPVSPVLNPHSNPIHNYTVSTPHSSSPIHMYSNPHLSDAEIKSDANNPDNQDNSRMRRENHKQVERRRREVINEGINELRKIVPGCEKNKGSILSSAVAYIQQLKEGEASNIEKWTLEKLLSDQAMSELQTEINDLRLALSDRDEAIAALTEQVHSLSHELGRPPKSIHIHSHPQTHVRSHPDHHYVSSSEHSVAKVLSQPSPQQQYTNQNNYSSQYSQQSPSQQQPKPTITPSTNLASASSASTSSAISKSTPISDVKQEQQHAQSADRKHQLPLPDDPQTGIKRVRA